MLENPAKTAGACQNESIGHRQTVGVPSPDGALHNIPDHSKVLILAADPFLHPTLEEALAPTPCQLRFLTHPEELWAMPSPEAPTCLLCNHLLEHGRTALDVLAGARGKGISIPIAIMAADWETHLAVRFMKAGACDFLKLPLDPEALRRSIAEALCHARLHMDRARAVANSRSLVATLSERERQIVRFLLKGLINKEIADQLNLALVTVKLHRSQAMKKLGAGNPAELARIALLAGTLGGE